MVFWPGSVGPATRIAYASSLLANALTGAFPGVMAEIIGALDAPRFLLWGELAAGLAKLLQLFLGVNIEQAAGIVNGDEG